MTIEEFLGDTNPVRNLYLDEPEFATLYVRKGRKAIVFKGAAIASFPQFISRDVFHHDTLCAKADTLHALQTIKAQGNQFALRVLVADNQGSEPSRLQQVEAVAGNGLKEIEESVQSRSVGEIF